VSKIVIDARESGTGTGRYVDKLIEYLHKLQPEHSVILLAKAERLKFLAELAPSFVIIETPFKEFSFSEQIGFLRQLNGLEADLVHFPMVQQPVWYHGRVVTTMQDLTTIRFRNPTKNPVIFWVKQQVYKWVNKRVAKKSSHIVTISQFVKRDIMRYTNIPANKITVTYEAADRITVLSSPVESLDGKQFLMYIGRPLPHKNLDRLVEAFALLQNDRPDLWLALAGKKDSLYEQIADHAKKLGVRNIVFTDFITEGQLKWMYENCAAYVFPSLSEGFGLPALEALQHGAPLVSTNATCSPEISGDAAHYFDPLSIQDLALKISEVLDDPALRQDLIEKGNVQSAKYSWTRMAAQTLAVYENILRNNKH
jgi:glycosyltransferase involved in cell wall biosynthesis